MPNSIGPTGLTTATKTEILANYTLALQSIYGPDINLDPSTPDGQLINIFAQAVLDLQDLITQVNNQFDPDNAVGVILDQRVTYNGIQRQAGTYTVTNITLVISQACNLYGVDQSAQKVYTVADNAGNQWNLLSAQTIVGAGTYVFAFQAANPGAVLTISNTITSPVSIVLGVSTINNPTTYTTLGLNEESDAQLKIRRQKSVALASQGFPDAMKAALKNITGITYAQVFENVTNGTNADGVPGHSIWVIVAGTPASADVANAIYTKRSSGSGMFGAISFQITQKDGSPFIIQWDTVSAQNLFIKFTATSLDGINAPNISTIVNNLPSVENPGVFALVNINDIATKVQNIDPNTLVTAAGFSLTASGVYTNSLLPSSKKNQFVVSSPNIIVLPMILSPATYSIGRGGLTKTFIPLGGYGAMTFSMQSGLGTVNSVSGIYTSPAGPGTDVVLVTDFLGNTAAATVTVT